MPESVTSLRLSIDSREVKTAKENLDQLTKSAGKTEREFTTLASGVRAYQDKLGKWHSENGKYLSVQERLNNGLKNAGKSASDAGGGVKSLSLGFGALSSVIAGISIGALAKEFISTADAMTNVNNQLKLVTKSSEELATAQKELFAIAQRTRQDYVATASVYSNFALSMGEMGKSQKEILRVTETVNKAIAISGGTAQQAAAATMQLGQAFASGTLRGDELNSILENSKGLAQAIADGMGVPIGKLRSLGAEGKITAEILAKALEKSAQTVDDKFGKMVPTAEQSMTMVWNSIALMVSKTDTEINGSGGFASIMQDMSKSMDKNSDKIAKTVGKLGNEIGTRFRAVGSIIGLVSATVMYSATKLIEDTVNGWYNAFSWAEYGFNRLRGMSEKEAKASISLKPIDIGSSKYNDMMSGYIKEMEANAKRYENFAVNMPTVLSETEDKKKPRAKSGAEETSEQKKAREKREAEAKKALEEYYSELKKLDDEIFDIHSTDHEVALKQIDEQAKKYEEQGRTKLEVDAYRIKATTALEDQELKESNDKRATEEGKAIEEKKKKQLKAEEDIAKKKEQELERFKVATIDMADVAINAAYELEDALVDAFMTGKLNAQDMFRAIAADLARMAIRQAVTSPLMGAIAGAFGGAPVESANGNAFSGGKVQAFANGGAFTNSVVSKPTSAPMALFGEAGPEAIMPLQRTSDGKLGVVATGTPTQNIKIEMINQSGQELQTTQSEQKFNGEQWVIGVVIDAARRNRSGMRDVLRGGQ